MGIEERLDGFLQARLEIAGILGFHDGLHGGDGAGETAGTLEIDLPGVEFLQRYGQLEAQAVR